MSDHDTTIDDTDLDDDTATPASLREAAKRGREAAAEAAKLRKENLFLRAGIDTSTKLGDLLFKTFEGDDLDALKAEATELGVYGSGNRGATDTDRQQQDFRKGLSGGAAPDALDTPTPDPYDAAYDAVAKVREKGGRREDAAFAAFGTVFEAAARGDKRALHDPADWHQQAEEAAARRG